MKFIVVKVTSDKHKTLFKLVPQYEEDNTIYINLESINNNA